jgi:hypothetical protein
VATDIAEYWLELGERRCSFKKRANRAPGVRQASQPLKDRIETVGGKDVHGFNGNYQPIREAPSPGLKLPIVSTLSFSHIPTSQSHE